MFVLTVKRGVFVTIQSFRSASAARSAYDAVQGDVVQLWLGNTVFASR